ncbi:hypothetical protein KDRO_C07980 [Kluyveromyces lactis]|nr:hypothetical protein KDRO_C07980 [Kluyveromyces lactis]
MKLNSVIVSSFIAASVLAQNTVTLDLTFDATSTRLSKPGATSTDSEYSATNSASVAATSSTSVSSAEVSSSNTVTGSITSVPTSAASSDFTSTDTVPTSEVPSELETSSSISSPYYGNTTLTDSIPTSDFGSAVTSSIVPTLEVDLTSDGETSTSSGALSSESSILSTSSDGTSEGTSAPSSTQSSTSSSSEVTSTPSSTESSTSSTSSEVTSTPSSTESPTSSTTPTSSLASTTADSAATTTAEAISDTDRENVLNAHNEYRARHQSTNPLVWNDELAAYAYDYTQTLLGSDNDPCNYKLQHSGGSYGENLAAGTNSDPAALVGLWYDEINYYDYNNVTGISHNGHDVGHFTQLVWAASTDVGCSVTKCSSGSVYLICEYSPAGNVKVVGGNDAYVLYKQNVKPLLEAN